MVSRIPFTVYDFFAYLSSGSVLVATFDCLYGYQWLLKDKPGALVVLLLVFLSYVTGHVVAHFSAWLLEGALVGRVLGRPLSMLMGAKPRHAAFRRIFPGYYRPLPAVIQRQVRARASRSGIDADGEGLFLHAYALVTQDERAQARLDEFRNLYGFARNMALVFLLVTPAIGFSTRPDTGPWAALAAVLGLVMLYRYLKFFRQFSYQLLITYTTQGQRTGQVDEWRQSTS